MKTTYAYAQSANFLLTKLKKKGIYYNTRNMTNHVDNFITENVHENF